MHRRPTRVRQGLHCDCIAGGGKVALNGEGQPVPPPRTLRLPSLLQARSSLGFDPNHRLAI
jgi:hypothetical protein